MSFERIELQIFHTFTAHFGDLYMPPTLSVSELLRSCDNQSETRNNCETPPPLVELRNCQTAETAKEVGRMANAISPYSSIHV